jgi:hypothetical protein
MGIYYQILDDIKDYDPKNAQEMSLNLMNILGKKKALSLADKYEGKLLKDLKKLQKYLPDKNINLLSSLISGWKS